MKTEKATVQLPKAVIHVIDCLDVGGAELAALTIANETAARGLQTSLVTTRRRGVLWTEVAPGVGRNCLRRVNRLDIRAMFKLRRIVAKAPRPCVVHMHSSSLFFSTVALPGMRSVARIWHDQYGGSAVAPRPAWLYMPFVQRLAGVICVNEELRRWSIKSLGAHPQQVWMVPNPSRFNPTTVWRANPHKPKKQIIVLSNIKRQKGLDVLLRAFHVVIAAGMKVELLIAGAVLDPEYYNSLLRLVQELKLGAVVRFLGLVADVGGVLAMADLALLTSWSEGTPLALVEYGAFGLPVVVSDIAGCREIVGDNERGVLCKPGDAAGFAQATLDLLNCDERAEALGAALHAKVAREFSPARIVEQVLSIYQAVVSDKSVETGNAQP